MTHAPANPSAAPAPAAAAAAPSSLVCDRESSPLPESGPLPCPSALPPSSPSSSSLSALPRVACVLVGSGPASLSLSLRVLRPGLGDMWSDDESLRGGRYAQAHNDQEETHTQQQHDTAQQQQQEQPPSRVPSHGPASVPIASSAPLTAASRAHSSVSSLSVAEVRALLVVVDPLASWCASWQRHFSALHITHLRSTIVAHPCPVDPQSMRAFAAQQARTQEVQPIMAASSVAQRTSKQLERKRDKDERRRSKAKQTGPVQPQTMQCAATAEAAAPATSAAASALDPCVPFRRVTQSVSVWPRASLYDLAVPSSRLFRDFTRALVDEWKMDQLRVRDAVRSVRRVHLDDGSPWYLVEMASGRRMLSWSVVCAVGNSVPRWPTWAAPWRREQYAHKGASAEPATSTTPPPHAIPTHALIHSSEIVKRCFEPVQPPASKGAGASAPAASISSQLPPAASAPTGRLLIVGGGLTGAQLACELLRTCAARWHVTWCVRGWLRVKTFDVDLEWVSPSTANMCMHEFHSLRSTDAKIRAIRAARQGGSITHEANERVQEWRRAQRMQLKEHCEVQRIEWISTPDPAAHAASYGHTPQSPAASGFWRVYLQTHAPARALDDAPVSASAPAAVPLEVLECDAIWLCTGSSPDVRQHAFLADLARTHAVHEAAGLPIVDEQLRWTSAAASATDNESASSGTGQTSSNTGRLAGGPTTAAPSSDSPVACAAPCESASVPPPSNACAGRFHFVGGLGCLHLGPDAFNLRGAQAASRNLFDTVRGYIRDTAQWETNKDKAANTHHAEPTASNEHMQGATDTATAEGPAAAPESVAVAASKPAPLPLPVRDRAVSVVPVSSRVVPAAMATLSRSGSGSAVPSGSCGLRPTASSHRNQLSRGAKCLNCNLSRDPPRASEQKAGNSFMLLADDDDNDDDDDE